MEFDTIRAFRCPLRVLEHTSQGRGETTLFQISAFFQHSLLREETQFLKINTTEMCGSFAWLLGTHLSVVFLNVVTGGCSDLCPWCLLSLCTSSHELFGHLEQVCIAVYISSGVRL